LRLEEPVDQHDVAEVPRRADAIVPRRRALGPAMQTTAPAGPLPRVAVLRSTWAGRSLITLADQAAFSLWGLAVTLFAGHLNAPAEFAAFSIAFAALTFAAGFDNAFVLEPMTILGRARYASQLRSYIRHQRYPLVLIGGIRTLAFCFVGVVCLATHADRLAVAFFAAAVAGNFLLFGWIGRQTAYIFGRPAAALFGDTLALILVVLTCWALSRNHHVGSVLPFALLGSAGLTLGWPALARALRVAPPDSATPQLSVRSLVSEQLRYGSWQAGLNILSAMSLHVGLLAVAGFLGLRSAGIFRAALLMGSPFLYASAGVSLLLLPTLAEDFAGGHFSSLRRRACTASALLVAGGLAYFVIVLLAARGIIDLLFGAGYTAAASLVPPLALAATISMAGLAPSLMLRASQWPPHYLIVGLPTVTVSLVGTIALTAHLGLRGAAYATVLTSATATTASWIVLALRARRTRAGSDG